MGAVRAFSHCTPSVYIWHTGTAWVLVSLLCYPISTWQGVTDNSHFGIPSAFFWTQVKVPCSVWTGSTYYMGLFLILPLGSLGWPLSFIKLKVMIGGCYSWPLEVDKQGKEKPWCSHYCPCTGVKRTAILGDSRKTTMTPCHPQVPIVPGCLAL